MGTDLVIVLSSDWVGSTATRAQIGEERADALQELHDTLLRRAIDAGGGTVVKHSGDGVLAVFHSATGALGAAVQIQRDFAAYRASPDAVAAIDIRVGLAAGDIKQQSGDIFGMPVVEAVRLQSAAGVNEILCSDLVRMLSQGRGGFEFDDSGTLQLKGFTTPVHAFKVRRPDRVVSGDPAHDRSQPTPASRASRSPRKIAAVAAVGALVFAIAIALGSRYLGAPSEPSPATSAPLSEQGASVASEQPTPPPNSIAVLPFENLSPSENDAYFAIGIHDEILNQLTKLGSLHVVARTSVQRFADTEQAISEIARELNVANIMEGSVRYADGRVVVTTQLIDGATDAHLWSESYERPFSNIFAIQSDIALNVAQALETELLPRERAKIERVPTTSLAAYELYLSAVARGTRQTREEILRGLEEIDAALELDPEFAEAWAVKSALSTVAGYADPQRAAEHVATGEQAARRALDIDPESGRAHDALGFALFSVRDWIGSENAFRTALRLGEPLGRIASYSTLQLSVGNTAQARDVLQAVRPADPLNPTALAFLMMANALLGDWSTATAQYELGTMLFANWGVGHDLMMFLRVARGELDAARAIPISNPIHAAMIARMDAPDAALLELRRMHRDAAFADPLSGRVVATWAASFGDPSLAIDALRSSAMQQGGHVMYVWLPQYRAARQSPEFKELLRDLGIVRYWREFGWPAACRPLSGEDFVCE